MDEMKLRAMRRMMDDAIKEAMNDSKAYGGKEDVSPEKVGEESGMEYDPMQSMEAPEADDWDYEDDDMDDMDDMEMDAGDDLYEMDEMEKEMGKKKKKPSISIMSFTKKRK